MKIDKTSLIVETYEQLALGTSESISTKTNAKYLWHDTASLMTDSVDILEILRITYLLNHLLCKSHSVEALDKYKRNKKI